ncbi:argininosuccinate synthase [Candidatus Bipolaricaulota bacterium]|nr:argininosuccinate synthase [Candidatus Bipolaricaulota bacterium]
MYSGGLDTSVLLKWLQDEYGVPVSTFTIDVGQRDAHLDEVKAKALDLGAENAFVVDAKEEFAEKYITGSIKANGLYQEQYPLSTAIARPLMSEIAVKYAQEHDIDAIAHGSTGKGNDQVRFEASINALDDTITVLAPIRKWNMSRDMEMDYAEENEIPVPIDSGSPYSIDENLWGRSIECGVLEDPSVEPPENVHLLVNPISETPDEAEYVEIGFEGGVPVKLNGEETDLVPLIKELNKIAGNHGVGLIDMVEDRIVGLKSREIYETPAAAVILKAHKELEKYCSTRHENSFKPAVDQKWAEMSYQGLMFDPLVEELNAYIDAVNEKVDGTVNLKLFKGKATVVGRSSENGLYSYSLATYDEESTFDQSSSEGFIDIWGLPTKVAYNHHETKEG